MSPLLAETTSLPRMTSSQRHLRLGDTTGLSCFFFDFEVLSCLSSFTSTFVVRAVCGVLSDHAMLDVSTLVSMCSSYEYPWVYPRTKFEASSFLYSLLMMARISLASRYSSFFFSISKAIWERALRLAIFSMSCLIEVPLVPLFSRKLSASRGFL